LDAPQRIAEFEAALVAKDAELATLMATVAALTKALAAAYG